MITNIKIMYIYTKDKKYNKITNMNMNIKVKINNTYKIIIK